MIFLGFFNIIVFFNEGHNIRYELDLVLVVVFVSNLLFVIGDNSLLLR